MRYLISQLSSIENRPNNTCQPTANFLPTSRALVDYDLGGISDFFKHLKVFENSGTERRKFK